MTRRIRTYTFMESMIYKKNIDIFNIKITSKIKFEKIEFAKLIRTLQTKSKYILTPQAVPNKKIFLFFKMPLVFSKILSLPLAQRLPQPCRSVKGSSASQSCG